MAGKEGDRVVQGVKDGEIKAGSNQAVNGGKSIKFQKASKTVLVEILRLILKMAQLQPTILVVQVRTILMMRLGP